MDHPSVDEPAKNSVTGYFGLNYYWKVISENFIRLKMEASSSSGSATANPVQSCSMCPDKFLSNDKLVLHYVINHKYHICEVCTTVTSTLDDLKNHESETHLPLKCEICCYQITELSELTTHRATSHQLLTCHFCPLTLNTMFELNFHLKRKHFVLVEPLNLDQGLFKDFSMGKWGYLCLLCGKNRETSGFIGHYRGFHRIRVPTLAKILLKQNITPLSIMGTLGPEEEADHTKDLPDIDHTTHQPYANVTNTCNDSGQRQYQADVDLANIDGNMTSGSSQQTCIGVPKVEYPCHQTLIVPKVPETYLQTVYQMNAHMNQTLPVPSAICHQTRAIPNVSAPNAHELHIPNLSENDMGGPHETHVADNAMSSNICQQYTGVPAKHDFHSTLQPGVGVPNPSSHTYQIQSATNELPADPLKPEPIENKHSVASEGTRACGNIANQLTNEERLNYMPQYNRVPCDNPVNIRQGGNMGERLDMSGYPHQSVITNARGSAVHQPSNVVPSHLTHQLDSSHLVDNIQTSQLPNQISGTPYSSQSGDPNHSDTPYACQLSSNANQISRPPYGTDSSDNTGAMLPSQSYPGVVVGAYSEGLDGSGSQNIGHDVKYRSELSGGSGSQNTGSIPQYSSDLGADSGSQNIDSKMAYSAGLDGSQDTAGGNASGGDSLLYSMLLQGNRNPEESLEPPVVRQPTQDNSAATSPTSPTLPPDLSVSREDKFSSEPEDTSDEESTSSRRDGGMSSGYYVAGTSKPLATTDPSRRDGGMTSGYYVAGTSKPLATTDPRLYEDFDDVEPEVDPNDVECVLTETSDVESVTQEEEEEEGEGGEGEGSGSEKLMTRLYNMAMQGGTVSQVNTSDDSDVKQDCPDNIPKKLGKYLVLNNLVICSKIGLNQMEHAPNGFRCEVCHGYFDSREGLKELLRHMRTLHGIKCNKDTRHLSSVFDNFGRIKMTSYPEYCGPIHVCPFCSLRASSKRFLRRHVFTFHGDTWLLDAPAGPLSYACGQCKRSFWHMRERDVHEMSEHEDVSPLRCHICVRPFLRKVLVNEHIRLSHPEENGMHGCVSYKCRSCDILLADYTSLESHVKTEHNHNTVYRCSHCDLGLKNMKSLRYHIKMQHGKASQTFECELCGRVTYSLRSLNSHRRLKHDSAHRALFKCRLCSDTFETKDERQLHYAKQHVNQNPFICPDCGKGFASKSGLYGHRQVHKVKDQVQENFFKCQFCGKEFTRRDSYNEHLLIHMGPRHKCPHCNKDFVQRSNLVRHIRIHTGEKPYKCTHCDKTFSDKGACNSHIRVHTGEETCACPFCGQTFSKKQKLKYHVRKHTGEGLLECDICNKTFTNSYALKDHKATHARSAQNFNCIQCGSAFTENRFLNRHLSVVHSDIPCFACPFCEKIFSHQKALRTHILIHAGVAYLECASCSIKFVSRTSLHDHLAAEHAISVNHEFYHASFISLEPEQVGLVMPKFTDEEVLNMSNQERDEVMRDYFNQVIEGKIELETQFEFKLIQRNRAPVDPDKKGLIAKLKQEQRKSRPPPKKRGGKAGGVGDWGPGRRKGRGGKRGRREEGGGGGHDYNFRANYPRTIMSEDYDYENEQEDYSEDHDNYDAPSVHETSVINLSLRNPSNPTRRRQNSGHESGGEEMEEEEEEGQMPVEAFVQAEIEESEEEEEEREVKTEDE
ncbi:hypothetical protein M8J77_021725 [Diaphorina citri]|nr:hypothetical protein M8J77_021725 [Diaphorina citri]